MKVGFVTCVQLGLACMQEIYRMGGRLDLAITLPDVQARKKSGRVYLDEFCERNEIPLVKVKHIDSPNAVAVVKEHDLDWLFIIGWSQIAGPEILDAPKKGVLGMHPTLLPIGRGRAPIPWAIIKGLEKTGVTMFRLDTGVDTGEIAEQLEIPLGPNTNATRLYEQVAEAHMQLMAQAWPKLVDGTLSFYQQDESKVTEWPGRKPEDGRIGLDMDCETADRLIRGTTRPYPGAFVEKEGTRYRIWAARIEPGTSEKARLEIRDDKGPEIVLKDGRIVAQDWEVEEA